MSAISRYTRRQAMDVPVLYRVWIESYGRHVNKNAKLPSPPDVLYLVSNLSIITFEDAVENPYACLRRIAEILRLDGARCDEKRFRDFHERFREHDRTKKQGSTSNLDKVRRDNKKAIV